MRLVSTKFSLFLLQLLSSSVNLQSELLSRIQVSFHLYIPHFFLSFHQSEHSWFNDGNPRKLMPREQVCYLETHRLWRGDISTRKIRSILGGSDFSTSLITLRNKWGRSSVCKLASWQKRDLPVSNDSAQTNHQCLQTKSLPNACNNCSCLSRNMNRPFQNYTQGKNRTFNLKYP